MIKKRPLVLYSTLFHQLDSVLGSYCLSLSFNFLICWLRLDIFYGLPSSISLKSLFLSSSLPPVLPSLLSPFTSFLLSPPPLTLPSPLLPFQFLLFLFSFFCWGWASSYYLGSFSPAFERFSFWTSLYYIYSFVHFHGFIGSLQGILIINFLFISSILFRTTF